MSGSLEYTPFFDYYFSPEILKKREAVIARAVATGVACYPRRRSWLQWLFRSPETCELCHRGPCPGPIEKYEELFPE